MLMVWILIVQTLTIRSYSSAYSLDIDEHLKEVLARYLISCEMPYTRSCSEVFCKNTTMTNSGKVIEKQLQVVGSGMTWYSLAHSITEIPKSFYNNLKIEICKIIFIFLPWNRNLWNFIFFTIKYKSIKCFYILLK